MTGPIRQRMKDEKYLRRKADRAIINTMARIHGQMRRSYANYSKMGAEERFFIREVKGLEAVWVAAGGAIERSTIRVETLEPPPDNLAFAVEDRSSQMRSKEFWTRFEALMLRSLRRPVDQRMTDLRQLAGEPTWLLESNDPSLHVATWPVSAWAELNREGDRFEIGVILPVAAAYIPRDDQKVLEAAS